MTHAQSGRRHANRLARETSPYLLQHAHNPVDWYAWGPEAFEAARSQNKPIFLSVGYSTCYWCHVMERQCFENERIAGEMNRRFINIKVDREERPDVDQLYMSAVQVLTRQGGWPMSVFLTPDLRPFYGGTYFPPEDVHGRPGFLTVLRGIEEAYRERPGDVEKTASQLVQILGQLAHAPPPESDLTVNFEWIDSLVDRSAADYDENHGGFGAAPKFPRQTLLAMLLSYLDQRPPGTDLEHRIGPREGRITRMLRRTLDAMAEGGMRDQLGGGFHRYSTDAQWLVPHFEIMLYDNAMLGWIYAEAYRQFEDLRYARVARGIFDFILRDMTAPQGAFYTALDAEVDAHEGQNYLWTAGEVEAALGADDAKLFNTVYGLDRGANFNDPHFPDEPGRNVLYLPRPLAELARELGMSEEALEEKLAPMRQKLLEARRQRKGPMLDTKVITSWNALMIRALAYGGRVLAEPRYIEAAARAADFLLREHLRDDGALWRTSREGNPRHEGFLEDHAYLAWALLELHNAGGDVDRKTQVKSLANQMLERFADADAEQRGGRAGGGLFFTAAGAEDVIVRQKTAVDSPLPSANAVAAMVLQELGRYDLAEEILAAFAAQLQQNAEGMSAMLEAAIYQVRSQGSFTVSGEPSRPPEQPISPQQMAAGVVSLVASWMSERELHVHVGIAAGFHINAHPASQGLIGTELSVTGDAAGEVQAIDYPPGEEERFAFADKPIRVYDKVVTIAVRFKTKMSGQPAVRMALKYQACNDEACLPVISKQFEVNTP